VTSTADLGVTVTSATETRLVEADLGPRYRRDHLVYATSGRGVVDHLVPHRVRALYRRPRADVDPLASADWVLTQVIVIGRAALALARHEEYARSCRRATHDGCGHPPPPERQRTFTDLRPAPAWVGDVVRALADARPPTGRVPPHPDHPTALPAGDRTPRTEPAPPGPRGGPTVSGHRPWHEVRDELHRRRLDAVPLVRDEYGVYVAVRDGTSTDDEDVVRLYLDRHAGTDQEARFPLTLLGDLGRELSVDEGRALALGLLALLRERTRRAHRAAGLPTEPPLLDPTAASSDLPDRRPPPAAARPAEEPPVSGHPHHPHPRHPHPRHPDGCGCPVVDVVSTLDAVVDRARRNDVTLPVALVDDLYDRLHELRDVLEEAP
jgi:hypothetical protein